MAEAAPPTVVLRVGNCSGFYGDRLSAMREMLEGRATGPDGTARPLDVLTGDYRAELTTLILGRDAMRDSRLGYARTFVRQLEDTLGLALEQGTRIVVNTGGLNPAFVDPTATVTGGSLLAPMPGSVVSVLVEQGATVDAGQPVLVLEAMKMQHTVTAPYDGTVVQIDVTPGTQVASGEVLAVVEEA